MARSIAFVVIALLAISFVAEVSAQNFCRISAYKDIDVATVKANKEAMFKNCGAQVTILETGTKNGCSFIKQQVKNEAAWKAYSDCEKKESNAKLYGPLAKGSKACESVQSKGAC